MGQMASGLDDIKTQPDWNNLTGGEQVGKLGLGALKGGLRGLSNMQQQNQAMRQPSGGGNQMQIPMTQQPQIQLPGVNPSDPNKMRNPFFGQ